MTIENYNECIASTAHVMPYSIKTIPYTGRQGATDGAQLLKSARPTGARWRGCRAALGWLAAAPPLAIRRTARALASSPGISVPPGAHKKSVLFNPPRRRRAGGRNPPRFASAKQNYFFVRRRLAWLRRPSGCVLARWCPPGSLLVPAGSCAPPCALVGLPPPLLAAPPAAPAPASVAPVGLPPLRAGRGPGCCPPSPEDTAHHQTAIKTNACAGSDAPAASSQAANPT